MKKKILSLLVALVMVLSTCFIPAYASEGNLGGISPCYTGVSYVTSSMGIDDQILSYSVDVVPFTDASIDRVHIDAELRTLGGRVDKIYDEDLEKCTRLYVFQKRRAVSVEGTYFLKYTLTCYKKGKVVDTISETTRTATYTR